MKEIELSEEEEGFVKEVQHVFGQIEMYLKTHYYRDVEIISTTKTDKEYKAFWEGEEPEPEIVVSGPYIVVKSNHETVRLAVETILEDVPSNPSRNVRVRNPRIRVLSA